MSTAAPARRAGRRIRWVVGLVFALIPLTFVQNEILGFQLAGWAWFLILCAVLPLALTEPVNRRALRLLVPYLLFLTLLTVSLARSPDVAEGVATTAQLTVPALVYLVAWRLPDAVDPVPDLERRARWGLVAAVVLLVAVIIGIPLGLVVSTPRPMAVSLVVLFVCASLGASTRTTLWLGAVSVGIAVATGSRASAAVLLLVIIASPSLRVSWRGRAAAVAACAVLLVAVSQTAAFRERFFFDDDASLVDILTLSENVNTAGRRELWPKLLESCAPGALIGNGVGSAGELSLQHSGDVLAHPHNEYIRVFCDAGVAGSAMFWGFFAAAGWRSWQGRRDGSAPALHGAAALLVAALLVLSLTDNPLVYTAHFMAPVAAVLALSDRRLQRRPVPPDLAGSPRPAAPAVAARTARRD